MHYVHMNNIQHQQLTLHLDSDEELNCSVSVLDILDFWKNKS